MVQQTLLVVLCLEHPMKDKRSGYFNVLRSQYHGAVWDIFLLQKHANITCVLCWQDFVSLSFIGLLTISSVSLLLFIERKKTLSTDFSLIRDNVFIHYTPIILIKIKFMCLVLCIILKIFSKALCSIVTLSPECCRTSIHVYWWLKSTWPWRHSKLVPLVRWTPS